MEKNLHWIIKVSEGIDFMYEFVLSEKEFVGTEDEVREELINIANNCINEIDSSVGTCTCTMGDIHCSVYFGDYTLDIGLLLVDKEYDQHDIRVSAEIK